jgi:hypothetical protein
MQKTLEITQRAFALLTEKKNGVIKNNVSVDLYLLPTTS